jgi:hypothetical protein
MLQGSYWNGLTKVTSAYDLPSRCNISYNMFFALEYNPLILLGCIKVIEFGHVVVVGFLNSNFLFHFL